MLITNIFILFYDQYLVRKKKGGGGRKPEIHSQLIYQSINSIIGPSVF